MITMLQRVQCKRCQAHRDLALTRRCFVCGSDTYDHVGRSPGDIAEAAAEAATADILQAAKELNWMFVRGLAVEPDHPFAQQLVEACQRLQVVRPSEKASTTG